MKSFLDLTKNRYSSQWRADNGQYGEEALQKMSLDQLYKLVLEKKVSEYDVQIALRKVGRRRDIDDLEAMILMPETKRDMPWKRWKK